MWSHRCPAVTGLDSFTIIAPGPSDIDQDGPALVGDPDMGFVGLRQFGPTLTHHTELKVSNENVADVRPSIQNCVRSSLISLISTNKAQA